MFGRKRPDGNSQSFEELRRIYLQANDLHTDDPRLAERAATAQAKTAKGYQLFESDRQALADLNRESRKAAPPPPKMHADDDSDWRWW